MTSIENLSELPEIHKDVFPLSDLENCALQAAIERNPSAELDNLEFLQAVVVSGDYTKAVQRQSNLINLLHLINKEMELPVDSESGSKPCGHSMIKHHEALTDVKSRIQDNVSIN